MNWPVPLQRAHFVRRDNRFRAWVLHEEVEIPVHVANSGRLSELLRPGAAVWIRRQATPVGRKTSGDLALVEYAGVLVSIDARLPNKLTAEGLARQVMAPFAGYSVEAAEVSVGHSRLDFLASTSSRDAPSRRCWIETKSVTLVEDGLALFPDAPTERGLRHLHELATLRRSREDRAAVVFVVQRPDAMGLAPHPTAHPAFAVGLREAQLAGVEVYAWRCSVDLTGIALSEPIAVHGLD